MSAFRTPMSDERLSTLSPVSWQLCCRIADGLIADDTQFRRAEIEDLMGTPVLRLSRVLLPDQLIDLAQGERRLIEMADAQAIAGDAAGRLNRAAAGATGPAATIVAADELEDEDQWTVGRYHSDQPLFRFTFDDPQRSTLYVSGANGRLVLRTTATQRFWNWLGAIPHWFYPTVLRSDGELWSQTVKRARDCAGRQKPMQDADPANDPHSSTSFQLTTRLPTPVPPESIINAATIRNSGPKQKSLLIHVIRE